MTTTLHFPSGHSVKSAKINTGLFINNKFQPSESGKEFEVVNPTDESVICKVAEASPKDVDTAVAAARKAFQTWGRHTPGGERGKLLWRLSDLVEKNKEILASIEALDNGKAFSFAMMDVGLVIDCIRYYAGWADKQFGQVIEVDDDTGFNYTRPEPIGVCGQIIPWNFPLLMWAWKISPALACGCTIVMKTAEQTPLSALKAAELVAEAGFPPGVFNLVMGFGAVTGAAIASHPNIDKVAFTGSTLVGRSIAKAAASSNLKKVTLELGGKSPNVVFDDADIDQAVKWSAFGIYFNHGQCCCAGSRVYVQESIYDRFLEAFKKRSRELAVGDPFKGDTFQGPQVSALQRDRIMSYIESGKQEGATVAMGGNRGSGKGYYVEPTIFTDVKPNMRIVKEEIFGPVVVISKFKNEDDLIAQANDTAYGLAAAIFTRNLERAIRTAHRLDAGTVWVNKYNTLPANVPFGGYKTSGWGRELGELALRNYTEMKAIQINLGMPAP